MLVTLSADATQSSNYFHHVYADRPLQVIATGSFGSGTLVLQVLNEAGNWVNLPDASFTAAASRSIQLKGPIWVRYSLSGSTTPSIALQID
jgi:hypothetical protein